MTDKNFEVDVVISETQFRRFSIYDAFFRQKRWTRLALFLALMCGFGLLCFLKPEGFLLGIVLIAVGVLLPAVYVGSFLSGVKKKSAAFHLSQGRSLYRLSLSGAPDGIEMPGPKGKPERLRWADCTDALLDGEVVYLYLAGGRALFLPLAHVRGGTAQELWALVQAKLPSGKAKTRGAH